MKKYLLSLCLYGALTYSGGSVLYAGQPETVHSYTRSQMAPEWYREQRELWGDHVRANPTDAPAWMNYYKATRYAGFCDTSLSPQQKFARQQAVVDEMEKAVPNSFEYHYARWWSGGNNPDRFEHLQKALELREDYAELSDEFLAYYELQGDTERVKFFSQKWYETQEMPASLLQYHYNVLMSLEKNAVIVTAGDNDTYPIWLLQHARNIRPDVVVMNVGLIGEPKYRAMMMKRYHIAGDQSLLDMEKRSGVSWSSAMAEFLQSVAESNTERPIYFALTTDPEYLQPISERLYTVGLANRYSEKRIDNIALLQKNWEEFHLDYLDSDIYDERYAVFNQQLLPQLNMNYVTPALLMYEHYLLAGRKYEADRYRDCLLRIARAGGQEQEVLNYMAGLQPDKTAEPTDQSNGTGVESSTVHADSENTRVYPNPATGVLTLIRPTAERADIRIADLKGAIVHTSSTADRSATLDISGLATGTYILRITTVHSDYSTTFRIER